MRLLEMLYELDVAQLWLGILLQQRWVTVSLMYLKKTWGENMLLFLFLESTKALYIRESVINGER